ncbi:MULTISPECIES: pyrroline-5-carboxylate reductase [Enterococcus]|uniref:pyrroline-5-carboxylate reductase n=1 Tax=Enterococcus TaxID=1350 RepID=UPI0010F5359A|nr:MULTISPECIES: pyrroline-5-carboxylate reductase [Enterococcus]KAF1302520.1 pyrroline-5-carboxylate reductase [Enterococcus sp. JM9B]
MKKIGFIGAGNMARAIIEGLIQAKLYSANEILVYNHRYEPTLAKLVTDLQITPIKQREDLAKQAEIIVLAVKPHLILEQLTAIKKEVAEKIIVSIAAGVTIKQMEDVLGKEQKIVRVMPNTPALVGAGMSSVSVNGLVTEQDAQAVLTLFSSFGRAELLDESLIPAVIGVSGSSPAYTYMFIEALADGGVLEGLPRSVAYELAAQAVFGAAKMLLDTRKHPGELKDMVTSPGGTTIAAVKELEDKQLRSAVINAVHIAAAKDRELSNH